jgi:DNA-directed RNA polymerase specialized sigma24 family protein
MSTDPGLTKTDWSMIHEAGSGPGSADVALEQLARRYWQPVYAFIRSTGRGAHEAADLTQGFVCDVVLARRLFSIADPGRGRFRSLLLSAVTNYLREEHRRRKGRNRAGEGREGSGNSGSYSEEFGGPPVTARTRGRGGRATVLSMDPSQIEQAEPAPAPTPEAAFAAQWSVMLIRRVLDLVRQSCSRDGLEAHWTIFERRVVRPMLFNEPKARYSDLVERLGLEDASQAANMMVTVKRRFARALYVEVRNTLAPGTGECEIQAELQDLLHDLKGAASW